MNTMSSYCFFFKTKQAKPDSLRVVGLVDWNKERQNNFRYVWRGQTREQKWFVRRRWKHGRPPESGGRWPRRPRAPLPGARRRRWGCLAYGAQGKPKCFGVDLAEDAGHAEVRLKRLEGDDSVTPHLKVASTNSTHSCGVWSVLGSLIRQTMLVANPQCLYYTWA